MWCLINQAQGKIYGFNFRKSFHSYWQIDEYETDAYCIPQQTKPCLWN
jgi:hypothetical protein